MPRLDNIAAALSISPAFLDQYVAAARVAAKIAVGEAKPKLASASYPQPLTANQPGHLDGLPLGTRGGMKFRHVFPADGEYRFSIGDLGIDLYTRAVETRHTVIILVDGREVFREYAGHSRGPEVDRSGRRTGARGDHEALHEHPGAGEGRDLRRRCHVHRAARIEWTNSSASCPATSSAAAIALRA